MFHDQRNQKGRFARSANPTKDALRKRRARLAARKGVVIKGASGKAKVKAIRSEDGTRPSPAQLKLLTSQRFSYAPNYIRKGDVGRDGSVAANPKNPSRRRFATEAEAKQHGARFVEKEGHIGLFITKINEKPTSWVNVETGLTNEVA